MPLTRSGKVPDSTFSQRESLAADTGCGPAGTANHQHSTDAVIEHGNEERQGGIQLHGRSCGLQRPATGSPNCQQLLVYSLLAGTPCMACQIDCASQHVSLAVDIAGIAGSTLCLFMNNNCRHCHPEAERSGQDSASSKENMQTDSPPPPVFCKPGPNARMHVDSQGLVACAQGCRP
jgi:hypothetical protein